MDSSSVLLALEEQKKWRDRLKRIQDRIGQLDRKRVTLSKELADPVLDPLEAVTPLLLFLEGEEHAGGVHRGGTPEVRHYLTMMCPFSSFLRLGSRDHVPKEVEEVHRLIHEIFGDPFARIDTEH